MKPYLFKTILCLGAVLRLISCNEEISLDNEDIARGGKSNKICFVVDGQSTSRASTTSEYGTLRMTCLKRAVGNVCSYYFSNIPFTKDASGVWVSNPEWWWLDKHTHFTFYGYAPSGADGVTYIADEHTWQPKLDYTVPTDIRKQTDLVYNELTHEYIANENIAVPLTMKHALANIAFKTGTGMAAGKITKVTVKNVLGHGTLNLSDGKWTLDSESVTNFSIALDMNSADDTDITTDQDGTLLMLLPGSTTEQTAVEIEFTKTNGTYATYAGTLPAHTNWEACKQYRYTITVDPDLSIDIVPDTQDAHYVMCKTHISATNLQPGQEWELTASWDDDDYDGGVTLLPKNNPCQKYQDQGIWLDRIYEQQGQNGEPTLKGSARGTNILTGNGPSEVLIFIPEYISQDKSERTIKLSLKIKGESKVLSEISFKQTSPDWTTSKYGWEQFEDSPESAWGFDWERRVTFTCTGNAFQRLEYMAIAYIIRAYDNINENFMEIDYDARPLRGHLIITLNYGALTDLAGKTSTTDGLKNTKELYDFSGGATTGSLEQTINSWPNFEKNVNVNSELRQVALAYVLKKNKYNLIIATESGETTEIPSLKKDEIVWFLPALDEFQGNTPTKGDPLDGIYWSSTSSDEEADKENPKAWTNASLDYRKNLHKVRSCRMRP